MKHLALATVLSFLMVGCVGQIVGGEGFADATDAPRADSRHVESGSPDAVHATDAHIGTDAADDSNAPDVATAPDVYDAGTYSCDLGPPLSAPIVGCMPALLPSTGDPYEDCVRRINQFRCECQHLPPLQRWRDGEACANMDAAYDAMHPGMPHAGFLAGICASGYGQDECPNWGSIDSTISGCLQQMWDEGPGDFASGHGHYLNMSSTSFTFVACGFYQGSSGVYAVQNFE